jgi:hypothetical protein
MLFAALNYLRARFLRTAHSYSVLALALPLCILKRLCEIQPIE